MPLPSNKAMRWPPEELGHIYRKYAEWSAWYSGEPDHLADFYGGIAIEAGATIAPWWRFWSRTGRRQYQTKQRAQLHVPLAQDLASVSSALLFAEEPRVRIVEARGGDLSAKATEEYLRAMLDQGGSYNRLITASDSGAAIGGVYLRPVWDASLNPFPFIGVAQADQAVPDFSWGVLTGVTFFRIVRTEGEIVYRHLERHEMRAGRCYILHGLYQGNRSQLGERVPLTRDEQTKGFLDEFATPFDSLDVEYIPNRWPNALWRHRSEGMSDYAGSETLMDALDETYASWMRDVRLAKSRIMVPEAFLDENNRFDVDHEVFTPLNMLQASDAGSRQILANQFQIRWQEHQNTGLDLIERVVSNAGYSPQTYGLKIEGRAESGTALRIRENKTMLTMTKKAHFWRPALQRLFHKMLVLGAEVFGEPIEYSNMHVDVLLSDAITNDPLELAQTANTLFQAQSASREVRVRLLHPEWDEKAVQDEVKRLGEEFDAPEVEMPELGGGAPPPAEEEEEPEEPTPEEA